MDHGKAKWSTPEARAHTTDIAPIDLRDEESNTVSSRSDRGSPVEPKARDNDAFRMLPDHLIQQ